MKPPARDLAAARAWFAENERLVGGPMPSDDSKPAVPASEDPNRHADGRWKKGSAGVPGNPHLRHVSELRRAVRQAVTPEDIRAVLDRLHADALEGDSTAARIYLERAIGKPTSVL